jgi:hypothetical protein
MTASTADDRRYYRSGEGQAWLGSVRGRVALRPERDDFDFYLLADALGVGRFIRRFLWLRPQDVARAQRRVVVPGQLGLLVMESLR